MSPRAPHRFYYSGQLSGIDPQSPEAIVALSSDESHHLTRVLRIKPGMLVDIFDASGQAWSAEVIESERGVARVRVLLPLDTEAPDSLVLNLAVSVLKRRAMDWLIEKLSELGVHTLQPLMTARSIGHQDIKPYESIPERWDRLALSAAKQCGRNLPLNIMPPMPVLEWLERDRPPALCAFAHGDPQAQGIGQWLADSQGLTLPRWVAIGPEGGWHDQEVEAFQPAGFKAVGLGNLTLRAETAALAAAAACRLL